MTGAMIAELILTLGPVVSQIVLDGTKIVATMRSDMTVDEMIAALQASKSANWPKLTFGETP